MNIVSKKQVAVVGVKADEHFILQRLLLIPYKIKASTTPASEASMAKEVQMSIKMEPDLRDRFMAVAADRHRPAAQIIRDLMRLYIAESEIPNALTAVTLRKGRKGEDVFHTSSASDLFKRLGI